ncbi:MAG: PaaI family thioesterase [Beijerinckiaceae bacterium]|nr:PaaI family thioesterase [Beijerinckiaceae bacterium]MCZ8301585.1 PaaI family thioesterase [Beijerinckiaceae bacterium]
MSRYAPLPPDTFDRLSGLETLRAMIAGDLPAPPMAGTLNFDLIEAEEGRVLFAGTPLEAHLNPAGTVHGGWAATILDSALACAVHATLAAGERYTSVEMKLNYLRPILVGKTGRLSCEGKVIQRGRTLALSEARLVDSGGKLYAHASETCMIFPKA